MSINRWKFPAQIIFNARRAANSARIGAVTATILLHASLLQAAAPPPGYQQQRGEIVARYSSARPLQWGETVAGVRTRIRGGEKLIALTLDACGSPRGMGVDSRLLEFLERERIPATLFINARWIEPNRAVFDRLARNPLFEIANHGYGHRPASVTGRSAYGISGTKSVAEVVDEIELNARKIEQITGVRPRFYRSGTAYYDEVAVRVAGELGHQVAGFSVLGDAGATFSAGQVKKALLGAHGGDIVILHMNHPESGTAAGVIEALPELQKRGYRFVRLSDVDLE